VSFKPRRLATALRVSDILPPQIPLRKELETMTQMPPPPAQPGVPYQPIQPPRNNGWAIGSLICGILGCIPIITSLLAIIFGIIGIKKSNEPNTSGKGLAIVGIVLGIIGILGWAGFGAAGYFGYGMAKRMVLAPTQQVGGAFLSALASGDIATAKSHTTGEMSDEQLESLSGQVKGLGGFKDFSLTNFQANSAAGNVMTCNISGAAHFANGDKTFTATLVGTKSGNSFSFKIEDFKLH